MCVDGWIPVDPLTLETRYPGVYAVGDVVATPQLAHVAFSEGIVAIKTMLGEEPAPIDYEKVPWGIYCHPEVAFCGLTEAQRLHLVQPRAKFERELQQGGHVRGKLALIPG